jgi:putative ABC transport system ATP-binding protein
LLHLLGGLDNPSGGTVTLADQPLSGVSDRQATLARRHHIGFVFQFFNLVPTLSAEENVLLPLIIDGKEPRQYSERLDTLLKMVGLDSRRTHRPDQLSGGEQQRVAIARALITRPAVLLADEPTGNLDSKTGKLIMELLRRSCDELGQSIVVVTHDPRAAAYADRVVFLRDGLTERQILLKDESALASRLRIIMDTMEAMEF